MKMIWHDHANGMAPSIYSIQAATDGPKRIFPVQNMGSIVDVQGHEVNQW